MLMLNGLSYFTESADAGGIIDMDTACAISLATEGVALPSAWQALFFADNHSQARQLHAAWDRSA
jgi:hypothetical protein